MYRRPLFTRLIWVFTLCWWSTIFCQGWLQFVRDLIDGTLYTPYFFEELERPDFYCAIGRTMLIIVAVMVKCFAALFFSALVTKAYRSMFNERGLPVGVKVHLGSNAVLRGILFGFTGSFFLYNIVNSSWTLVEVVQSGLNDSTGTVFGILIFAGIFILVAELIPVLISGFLFFAIGPALGLAVAMAQYIRMPTTREPKEGADDA